MDWLIYSFSETSLYQGYNNQTGVYYRKQRERKQENRGTREDSEPKKKGEGHAMTTRREEDCQKGMYTVLTKSSIIHSYVPQ
jgi:hypothetical protein